MSLEGVLKCVRELGVSEMFVANPEEYDLHTAGSKIYLVRMTNSLGHSLEFH